MLVFWDGGNWRNSGCGCSGGCVRSGPGMIHLPGPVQSIDLVVLENDVLDTSEYVLEGDILYRTGGKAWPSQNLSQPMGSPGTWYVQYQKGLEVPPGGDKMAGILAQEFIAACDGDGECRLPRTVIRTTRQGVTHTFDASAVLAAGSVGIPEIDLWVTAINPHHLTRPPVVL